MNPEQIAAFFFNSTAHIVVNDVLASMISGYDGVEFDMINQVIDIAQLEPA